MSGFQGKSAFIPRPNFNAALSGIQTRFTKVYVIQTAGGMHSGTAADSQTAYLRTVLGFLGMTDIEFVYAEGLAMGEDAEQSALKSAEDRIFALAA